jgi:hypothetical protein
MPVASTNVDVDTDTIGPLNSTRPGWVRVSKTKAVVAVAIGAILALGAIVVFALMHEPKVQKPIAIGSSMPSAYPPPIPTEAPSIPTLQAPASASVPPSNSPLRGAETLNSPKSVPARPAVTKRPPLPSVPAHPPRPDCDPNFFFDAHGEKHFKSECFR